MLGWINDCIEKLVLEKFGVDAWHIVKQKAGCEVPDGGFYKLDCYTDKSSVDLVQAASEVSGLSFDGVLEAFGEFFVHYIRDEGYDNLLCCQGSTLKDWMSNINAIHQHLQTTFPKKMTMPQFWCEDGVTEDGSLMLHYHSRRGNYLAPLAKGLVSEIAQFQFGVKIDMQLLRTQDVDGAEFTSWKVTAVNPQEQWKLTQKVGERDGKKNAPTSFKCPFTGMTAHMPARRASAASSTAPCDDDASEGSNRIPKPPRGCPMSHGPQSPPDSSSRTPDQAVKKTYGMLQERSASFSSSTSSTAESYTDESTSDVSESAEVGLSGNVTKGLFPYHVMVDNKFTICQVGRDLPGVLRMAESDLTGQNIAQVLDLTKPVGVKWDWEWLRKLEDQSFEVEPVEEVINAAPLRFKASVVHVSDHPPLTMIILNPDANNLEDLREMNLTLSDLPVHGAHRDAIFLREHLSTQMNSALKMEKLSRSLEREKQLLESLLPEHAAAGLRAGTTIEPMLHNNVTFFFSDIVGFTNICEQIYPWDVIGMLNRLYCAMDFLAGKFNLFKVETIGDAYVCCSGLPKADEDHAKNVANFAIAVNYCCRQVVSPLDETPIELRIGVHSGACASGVVGKMNPRYCVFGDTVNTTARHESTGAPGKIHCSGVTQKELEESAKGQFSLQERGYVDMKGKGELLTFWLDSSESNELVNPSALQKLNEEVKDLLAKTNFDTKMGQDDESAAKKRERLLKKVSQERSSRSLTRSWSKGYLGDSTRESLRNLSSSSLASTVEEAPEGNDSRSNSHSDTLDEALVLPCRDNSCSSLESETDITDVSEKEGVINRLKIEVNPRLSEIASGAGNSQEYDYFYFM